MSATAPSAGVISLDTRLSKNNRRLESAKTSVQFLLDPKHGPHPSGFRTRAFLRSFRYFTIFIFWRLVRYAKYAVTGAIIAAVSGTVIGSFASGAAFILAPTGILGGAGAGLIWAMAKFGWHRASSRLRKGENGTANARKDESEDAEGVTASSSIRQPRPDPW